MPLRARDIADICDDLLIERASVTVKEGWDYDPEFYVTWKGQVGGPMIVDPNWGVDDVKSKLEAATAPVAMPKGGPPAEAFKPYVEQIAKDLPAALKPAKRKKANARP